MTIEEKAEEYVKTHIEGDSYNPFVAVSKVEGKEAFKIGAEWMLNQIEDWLKNQPSIQYSDWGRLMENSLIKFKKAMEE